MKFVNLLAAVALVAFISGCEKKEDESKLVATPKTESTTQQTQTRKSVEMKFVLKDINGKSIELKAGDNGIESDQLKDKIIFLDFFATWCPPCKASIPHLVNLQNKYKDKLVIIGVLLEENKNPEELKSFIEQYKINYFVSNDSNTNHALAQLVYAAVQAPKNMPIPLMALFKDGKYITHYLGAVPEEMIESDIKKALGE
ncbi:TlpA family protein disulfide reductase [Nitrosophilus alvini]|uniref:TlpA family protein disulfide reductase n=1 Tax=Nitrosophilus alvini TaxID=2714855 RepID=UPI0019095768|nr:TlpA disulfide reductase family protein [Nitrosophilus alvini]